MIPSSNPDTFEQAINASSIQHYEAHQGLTRRDRCKKIISPRQ
jgi:hypothetical protein